MSVSGSHAVADLDDFACQLHEPLDELVGDRVDDVEALGRGADLAGVQVAGPDRAAHGHVEVGVLADDERVDAAESRG